MGKYIVRRILWLFIIVFCVAVLIFTIMYLIPGDPVKKMLGDTATEADIQRVRDEMGLNDPYLVQLGSYLSDAFIKFDFGTSYISKVPVAQEFATRLPRTLTLSMLCILLDCLIGIPVGITAAMHRNSPLDQGVMLFAMVGVSIPGFWLALLLVILFSVNLGLLPAFGIGTWKHWIMPVVAGAVGGIANNARQTRSAMLETIRADFVTTARAKGLAERKVTYKHILPNALIPIVNSLGGRLAGAISGTVVIETVFSFPGIGTYLATAITNRDYPVVRSCILIMAIFSAVVMLVIDLVYAKIDPRIKAQYVRMGAKKGGTKA